MTMPLQVVICTANAIRAYQTASLDQHIPPALDRMQNAGQHVAALASAVKQDL